MFPIYQITYVAQLKVIFPSPITRGDPFGNVQPRKGKRLVKVQPGHFNGETQNWNESNTPGAPYK